MGSHNQAPPMLFHCSKIHKEMAEMFMRLVQESENMQVEHLHLRVHLFKAVAMLSFQDESDLYQAGIRRVMKCLNLTVNKGELIKYLYDLTGIFEGI